MFGADPPHIEEQPVAFATSMRSPNSWVTSLMYGVSPQPEQAPENSIRGWENWLPFTVKMFVWSDLSDTFSIA